MKSAAIATLSIVGAVAVAGPASFVVHLAGTLAISASGEARFSTRRLSTQICHLRVDPKAYLVRIS